MKWIAACLCMLFTLQLHAQNNTLPDSLSTPKAGRKNYFGVRFGGIASTFSHSGNVLAPTPGKKSVTSWHAGVAMDLFTQKFYNARMELSYINKGARETFSNDRIDIESSNQFGYVQYSLIPVVIKPGFRKVNPYIALGGYYARGVAKKSKWKQGANAEWETDAITAANLDISQDYGYSISAGVYVWKRPIFEIRYENGLRSVSSATKTYNRSLVLSISI